MIDVLWLNPAALLALAAVAGPILIHILVRRRAERFPFPTLRFLQPTRLAAIRRHVLEDGGLLAVRAAILAAAVAALAGPLILTAARRQAWEGRTVRAVVVDEQAAAEDGVARASDEALARDRLVETLMRRGFPPAFQTERFGAASLPDGVHRAIAWLDTAPPARRELVILSPFAIGSIADADIAAIPAGIGVRLERSGTLPASRTVPAGRVLTSGRSPEAGGRRGDFRALDQIGVLLRDVTFAGDETIVRDTPAPSGGRSSWPIDFVSVPSAAPLLEAAAAAVLSQRVWTPAPDRRARLVIVAGGADASSEPAISEAAPVRQPWMADAIARLAHDADLAAAAGRVSAGLDGARFTAGPWQVVASSADGRPLVVAAASPTRLLLVCAASAGDLVVPLVVRSLANGMAAVPDLQQAEVVPIADRWLRGWSRPAAAPAAPGVMLLNQGDDDRRWFWLAALCLLAIETWMRRARPVPSASRETIERQENVRVA